MILSITDISLNQYFRIQWLRQQLRPIKVLYSKAIFYVQNQSELKFQGAPLAIFKLDKHRLQSSLSFLFHSVIGYSPAISLNTLFWLSNQLMYLFLIKFSIRLQIYGLKWLLSFIHKDCEENKRYRLPAIFSNVNEWISGFDSILKRDFFSTLINHLKGWFCLFGYFDRSIVGI